jgi:hypothetical protein
MVNGQSKMETVHMLVGSIRTLESGNHAANNVAYVPHGIPKEKKKKIGDCLRKGMNPDQV